MCVCEVGREGVSDTRKARTPLLDTTAESRAVGGCHRQTEGKVVALVDVRRACFYAPARRREFVDLPPEDYQGGDEHVCGLLHHRLYGTRDAAQNWEEELASTLGNHKLTRGIVCPCEWQGCIKGEHIVATVNIGGE